MRLQDLFTRHRIVKEFRRQNLFARSFDYCADAVRPSRSPDDFAARIDRFKCDEGATKGDAGRKVMSGQIFDLDLSLDGFVSSRQFTNRNRCRLPARQIVAGTLRSQKSRALPRRTCNPPCEFRECRETARTSSIRID